MYLLDTNTLSDLLKDHPQISVRLRAVPGDRPVVTAILVRIEILQGRFAAVVKAANRTELLTAADRLVHDEARLAGLTVLPVTPAVADEFDRLRALKRLKKIGRKDLLIACFALAHDATLVTRNVKDFAHVPGLTVENWAD